MKNHLNQVKTLFASLCDRLRTRGRWLLAAAFLLSLAACLLGYHALSAVIAGAAAARLFVVLTSRRRAAKVETVETPDETPAPARAKSAEPDDIGSLVEGMLAQGREALLLRSQIISNLDAGQAQRAREALRKAMAICPAGPVMLLRPEELESEEPAAGESYYLDGYLLDRYPVTNRQYQEFVDAGAYEQMALWDPAVLPAVLDFVDLTGRPGPRFWANGTYPPGKADHPVVGVSYHEAAAYARWVGKRLPSGAEWVKAGAWPTLLSPTDRQQRRYPWGDAMERGRANVWGAGPNDTVSVREFPAGASVGGIYQLIGNVWEWTTDDYVLNEDQPAPNGVRLKSIRGGAFNTYFENHVTCQFSSGENSLARKDNIGFRCAVSLCDVTASAETNEPTLEEEPQECLV